jgi:hypothetical protein
MSKCVRCEKLEDELERAALEYLETTVDHKPDDDLTKAAKGKMDEVQARFNQHQAKHEAAGMFVAEIRFSVRVPGP